VALLNTDGAWIAIGTSLLFIVAGLVMHRVFVSVLKGDKPESNPHE
jgi:hypothetical protein